jgi:hypothetical protein
VALSFYARRHGVQWLFQALDSKSCPAPLVALAAFFWRQASCMTNIRGWIEPVLTVLQ